MDAISNNEPEAILDRTTVKRGSQAVTKVLIKWKHHLPEDASGKYYHLKKKFPFFYS